MALTALRAVVFDVGETLVDETGMWERAADAAGSAALHADGRARRPRRPRRAPRPRMGAARRRSAEVVLAQRGLLRRCAPLSRRAAVASPGRRGGRQHARRDARSFCASTSTWSARPARWGVEKPARGVLRAGRRRGRGRPPVRSPTSATGRQRRRAGACGRHGRGARPARALGLLSTSRRPQAIRIQTLAELPEALGV